MNFYCNFWSWIEIEVPFMRGSFENRKSEQETVNNKIARKIKLKFRRNFPAKC